ncbi:AAA family ATPase [Streptomyces sp. NPDC003035]|uniref:AAA family ATPase n=1 Tax=Streptomyces sp. NPDC003035 TaxID=3364676 RepID=UPI0036B5DEAE
MQFSSRLGPVTLLAGQNNSGKSNFLRMLKLVSSGRAQLGEHDIPQGRATPCRYAVAFDPEEAYEKVHVGRQLDYDTKELSLRILKHPSIYRDGQTWIASELSGNLVADQFDAIIGDLGNATLVHLLQRLKFSGYSTGGEIPAGRDNISTIVAAFIPSPIFATGSVVTIEAFRQIQHDVEGGTGNNEGLGLLERLQRLQNPPAASYGEDTERFEAINRFVRRILDDDTARLDVQHDARTLNVFHNGRMLPLENLGTGVHQVIVLAAAATVNERKIVCIEEPEVHLHPVYQRKFIRYLARETSNQYLIATHSAHMLDHQAAVVLHVRHDGVETRLDPAVSPSGLSGVCADLGYRPSDLLQSNAVIWVEGPSDRIYITHWIKLLAPELIEGIHYTVMFYGGGLLNHLTVSDDEVGDFIKLRSLNRYSAIVIDSDKKSARARISATKKRVMDGFNEGDGDGFAWLTDGYTIENYVPERDLRDSVSLVHPSAGMPWTGGKYENPLALTGRKGSPDKNRIARLVCDRWISPPSQGTPLGKWVRKCIAFINEANRTSVQFHSPR